MGSAADTVLKQFEDALKAGPLLCTIAVHRRIGGAERLPNFDSVHWHAQAVASLAAARVFESQAEDLKTASSQLMQMFLPGYQRNQLQRSCRLTAPTAADVALQSHVNATKIFADDAAALQAVTKEAAYSLGKNRSSVSQLAAWAITSLACRSKADCNTVAIAGGSSVLVNQLQYQPLDALEGLGEMAELHAELVWDSLLTFSGLTKLVDQTKAFDLHNEAGLTALSRLIRGLHKLVQHPHNQAAVLQELKSSEALELCFICAKSGVDIVSKPAIDCLVLIWQWYLRKSPSASFSLTQMSCFLPKGILSTSVSDGGVLAEVQRQAALEASTAVAGPVTAGVATGALSITAVGRDASQLWSVEPVIDFAFETAALNSPRAQPGTAPALLSQQQRLDSTPASDPRADSKLPQSPSRSALLPERAPPPPTRDQCRVSTASTASPVSFRAEADAVPLKSIVFQHSSSSDMPRAPLPSSSPISGGHFLASPGSQYSPSSAVTQDCSTSAQDYVRSSAPYPSTHSYPYPSAEISSPTKSSSAALSRQSLQQSSFSASTAASSTDTWLQQARRHSVSNPDSRGSFSSLLAPFKSTCVLYHQPQPICVSQLQALDDSCAPADAAEAPALSSASAQVISVMDPHAEAESSRAVGNVPAEGSGGQPNQALPSQTPAPFSSSQSTGPRQTESLEYIQSWLDTNPEGQWSPFPFSHQPSPVKSQPEGLERQTPAQHLPPTPEAERPTQRALQFSPMSVTQPGAEVMHANLGKVPSLEDAYLRERKDSNPAHEDSAWGSFDPQVAWSASGSSLVSTPRLESATSCDTHTHTGHRSVATMDNISKPSVDSPNRLPLETTIRSPSLCHVRDPVAAANRPALAHTSKTSLDLPGSYAVIPSSRSSLDGHSTLPTGKGKKWTKFLIWLTDPDTRDAARAKRSGKPVKRGALYDLATPIGRCPA
ncbi:TPA: hypothetical protein ACH3X1_016150 [Trebouxia sp. C0004]